VLQEQENRSKKTENNKTWGTQRGSRRGAGNVSLSTLSGRPITRPGDTRPGDLLRAQWADEDDQFQVLGGKVMVARPNRKLKKPMLIPMWRTEQGQLQQIRTVGATPLCLNEPHAGFSEVYPALGGSVPLAVYLDPERLEQWREMRAQIRAKVKQGKDTDKTKTKTQKKKKKRLTGGRGKRAQASSSSSGSSSSSSSEDSTMLPDSDEELLWLKRCRVAGRGRSKRVLVRLAYGTIGDVCSAPVPHLKQPFEDLSSSDSSSSSGEDDDGEDPSASRAEDDAEEVFDLNDPGDDEFCRRSEFHPLQDSRPRGEDQADGAADGDEVADGDVASTVRRCSRFRAQWLQIGKVYMWREFRICYATRNGMPGVLVERVAGSLVKAARS
jgi:hypothetical protein